MSRGASISLACGDNAFLAVPHAVALDLIGALGFDGVKLVLWEGRAHVSPHDVRGDTARWAGRLGERVHARRLEIVDVVCIADALFAMPMLNHPSEGERRETRAFVADMIDFAARLDAPGITIFPGVDWGRESHEESLARAARELLAYVAAAGDRGVALSIEPHVGTVCQTPSDAKGLCEAVPGLRLALDYTQFVAQGISADEADVLVPEARVVHARGAAPGRLHAPVRDSTIDYGRIIEQLDACGYRGAVAVEYAVEPGEEDLDVLSETVAMRDLLRTAIARLPTKPNPGSPLSGRPEPHRRSVRPSAG